MGDRHLLLLLLLLVGLSSFLLLLLLGSSRLLVGDYGLFAENFYVLFLILYTHTY
jgi:hypothetical protein